MFHAPRDERAARMRIYAANCFSLFLFANALRSARPERACVRSTREGQADREEDEYGKNLIARRIDGSIWFSFARCKIVVLCD